MVDTSNPIVCRPWNRGQSRSERDRYAHNTYHGAMITLDEVAPLQLFADLSPAALASVADNAADLRLRPGRAACILILVACSMVMGCRSGPVPVSEQINVEGPGTGVTSSAELIEGETTPATTTLATASPASATTATGPPTPATPASKSPAWSNPASATSTTSTSTTRPSLGRSSTSLPSASPPPLGPPPTSRPPTTSPPPDPPPTATTPTESSTAPARPPAGLDPASLADALAGVHFAPMRTAAELFGAGRSGWAVELAYVADGNAGAVAGRLSARFSDPPDSAPRRRGRRTVLRGFAEALRVQVGECRADNAARR